MKSDRILVIRGVAPRELFTEDELAIADAFKLAKRREEWLLSRAAAKQLAVRLGIAEDPRRVRIERPSLLVDGEPTEWHVSISHSAPYAAAAIDRNPVGIDIQVVRELDESAAHLFLSDAETEEMHRCAIAHSILHFWCAKEAAWKQKSSEFSTMKQLRLQLVSPTPSGLIFDVVQTSVLDDLIIAVTR
jgi:phosphopantetheinyl transferase